MLKRNIRIIIPLLAVIILLIYSWSNFLAEIYEANWKHYLGLILFIILLASGFKNLKYLKIGLGIYLLLATFNAIAFSPAIKTSWIKIGTVSTPQIQLLAAAIFLFYFILNFDNFIDIYLDYKESKEKRK